MAVTRRNKSLPVFSHRWQFKQNISEFHRFALGLQSNRTFLETVNAEVTGGKLDIAFTPKVKNPGIGRIEILPAS